MDVLRGQELKYPNVVGRDIWEWGGLKSAVKKETPPKNWGKKPSLGETLIGEKTGRPQGKVIVVVVVVVVVECYCILYILLLLYRDLAPPHFA